MSENKNESLETKWKPLQTPSTGETPSDKIEPLHSKDTETGGQPLEVSRKPLQTPSTGETPSDKTNPEWLNREVPDEDPVEEK